MGAADWKGRRGKGRLLPAVCPFCDHETRSAESLIRCRNCLEVFEREPDEEEFLGFPSRF